jgi:hypothetical protein
MFPVEYSISRKQTIVVDTDEGVTVTSNKATTQLD